jgi:hypothetical protein
MSMCIMSMVSDDEARLGGIFIPGIESPEPV